MRGHRQAFPTPRGDGKSDPKGGVARLPDVVANIAALLKNNENVGESRGGAAMFAVTRSTRTKRTRQVLPGAGRV